MKRFQPADRLRRVWARIAKKKARRGRVVAINPIRVRLEDGEEIEPDEAQGNHCPIGWHGTLNGGVFYLDPPTTY